MNEINDAEKQALLTKYKDEFHKLVPNTDINDLLNDHKVSDILHAIRACTKEPTCEKGEYLLQLAREYKERKQAI